MSIWSFRFRFQCTTKVFPKEYSYSRIAYLWKNCDERSLEPLPDLMRERLVESEYRVLLSLACLEIHEDLGFVRNHGSSPKTTRAAFGECLSGGFLVRHWRQQQTLWVEANNAMDHNVYNQLVGLGELDICNAKDRNVQTIEKMVNGTGTISRRNTTSSSIWNDDVDKSTSDKIRLDSRVLVLF